MGVFRGALTALADPLPVFRGFKNLEFRERAIFEESSLKQWSYWMNAKEIR
jgi:hypothetical protein